MDTRHESWWHDATFYAIYPLGFCSGADGAPIHAITRDLDRVARLGFSALYLGPLFESGSHGYDTHDYFRVDARLGGDDDLAELVAAAHERGIRVVVDGVYNHVGRGFWAFERLRAEGPESAYRSWFRGVDFSRDNRFGDGFVYEGWEGVEELVALNHDEPAVRDHLIEAALHAVKRYDVDGIRLDVAYLLPPEFLRELVGRLRGARHDVWVMGEVIHGDYASFFADADLDSITNYECFKGLWSSFNDRNMHEIGHSLRRLFGPGGLLAGPLRDGRLPYSFADNHDVTRIASTLHEEGHLFPLHGLLWTMPGIPSVYYGSEYALHGTKEEGDESLRPPRAALEAKTHDLARWIAELNAARSGSRALRLGSYHEVVVESTTLVFERAWHDERVLVAVNADRDPVTVSLPPASSGRYRSLLGGATLTVGEDVPEIAVPALGTVIAQRVGP